MNDDGTRTPVRPVRLRVLLERRHWQNHRTFCIEYERAASSIDPRLRGTAPSRAQLYRWLSGELKGLPYGDHCRILERMFPEWSARQLFEPVRIDDDAPHTTKTATREDRAESLPLTPGKMELITSGGELSTAMIEVVRNAREYLIAVGSRSSESAYLYEIEHAIENRVELIHYRILIGPPHSQILKDHLLRILAIRDAQNDTGRTGRLHISLRVDMTRCYERFFVANERTAVVILPSANSPMNFDTGLIIRDAPYVQGLAQHSKGLYGKYRLETMDDVHKLEVLG